MSLQGKSFGRREHAARPQGTPSGPPAKPMRPAHIALALGIPGLFLAGLVIIRWALPAMATLDDEYAQAEQRVVSIVNQPVTHLPRTTEAEIYPGWFHPGAEKPDFDSVDVRKTQDFFYAHYTYVTSDLNPTEMFVGGDLEFNAMTKYFYVDRTVPKKRLSETEMLEINRLYRTIGRDERALTMWWGAIAVLLALLLIVTTAPILLSARKADAQQPML